MPQKTLGAPFKIIVYDGRCVSHTPITPPLPEGVFQVRLLYKPRGCPYRTILRLRKALGEMCPTTMFLWHQHYPNCGGIDHGKSAQWGVKYTVVCDSPIEAPVLPRRHTVYPPAQTDRTYTHERSATKIDRLCVPCKKDPETNTDKQTRQYKQKCVAANCGSRVDGSATISHGSSSRCSSEKGC